MLRNDVEYEGKRTNNLLKYKEMNDDEFKVIDIEVGPFRYINPSTGLEEEIETMSAIIIDYNNTKVGSGFTIDERKKYYRWVQIRRVEVSQHQGCDPEVERRACGDRGRAEQADHLQDVEWPDRGDRPGCRPRGRC